MLGEKNRYRGKTFAERQDLLSQSPEHSSLTPLSHGLIRVHLVDTGINVAVKKK